MTSRLETAANIAIIVTCIAIGVALFLKAPSGNRQRPVPEFRPEQALDALQGAVDYRLSDQTLLLVLSRACKFCNQSMPFYRRIVEGRPPDRGATRIVVLTLDERDEASDYLISGGVHVDQIVNVKPEKLSVLATPTLILVDRFGKIVKAWIGLLPENMEGEVLSAVLGPRLPG
jgi:thioredoxin-related protein